MVLTEYVIPYKEFFTLRIPERMRFLQLCWKLKRGEYILTADYLVDQNSQLKTINFQTITKGEESDGFYIGIATNPLSGESFALYQIEEAPQPPQPTFELMPKEEDS